ncbi:MAG: serine/threonine protein kinase [Deltaproteobacteria bacterium]|nr:serine/threonine protein kinase [Deltaproteobacteria bacterium]
MEPSQDTAEPRFEQLAEIAVGNTARVELCRVVGGARSGELCAVKRLHAHVAEDPAFVDMFRDEVWMTGALKNRHVVEMLGWGANQGGPWLAVELVRGVSLARLMKTVFETGEVFSERLVVFLGRSVCDGLGAAHALVGARGELLGLVHRDLTPGNVLLGFAGEVKITDFGLAKARQRVTRTLTGLLKGNPQYMSPEQVKNEELDARSDIFAVGVLLFELFSGRRPWTAANDFDTMRAITDDAPLDLSELRPRIDRALARIVERCLEKNPSERYQSAYVLRDRLDEWLEAHGYREGNDEALARFVKRNAMRQMRWFERATASEVSDGDEREADVPLDLGDEGPTLVQRSDHAAALVGELGGNPAALVVEGTTVKQLAKLGTLDFDTLPTGRHQPSDASDLVTVPGVFGARLIGFEEVSSAFALEAGTTTPYRDPRATDRPPPGVVAAADAQVPPVPRLLPLPDSTQLVQPIPEAPPSSPVQFEASWRREVPKTLQGLGAMPIPEVLLDARRTAAEAAVPLGASPSQRAPVPPLPPEPLVTAPQGRNGAHGDLPAVGAQVAPLVRRLSDRPPGTAGVDASSAAPRGRSTSGMRHDAPRGDFSEEADRLRAAALHASAAAGGAARAAELAAEATVLARRGHRAEATERLDEALRIHRALAEGQLLPPRPLASDALVQRQGSWFSGQLAVVRRGLGDRELVAMSMFAVGAVVVLTVLVLMLLA